MIRERWCFEAGEIGHGFILHRISGSGRRSSEDGPRVRCGQSSTATSVITPTARDELEAFIWREDAERFIEDVRGDEPERRGRSR